MLGKVVQLLGNFSGEAFKVVYGFTIDECYMGQYSLNFGRIIFSGRIKYSENDYDSTVYTYICGGHQVEEKSDGFKDVIVYNLRELLKEEKEEYLLVVIPYASKITTKSKKIAGRFPEEAILEMYPGDIVDVYESKTKKETYMVVQGGNELFLIKKNR